MEVLNLYLEGLSGDKVSEKTGVSKGAVVSIIKDAREGKYPELELKQPKGVIGRNPHPISNISKTCPLFDIVFSR